MTRSLILVLLLPAFSAGLCLGQESEADELVLSIYSRFGADKDVKVYNDEPVVFMTRLAGRENSSPLWGVTFVLYDEGGSPSREEDVLVRTRDPKRWGKPPSSFSHPLERGRLSAGRYRLRATKPGWKPAEIKFVKAEFGYRNLKAERGRKHYLAAFDLVLVDTTEKRSQVPVKVLIEAANGGLLDSAEGHLVRNRARACSWQTTAPVKISSKMEVPDRKKPAAQRTGLLKVVPHCRLVLVLDKIRFPWPVPLPKPSGGSSVRPTELEGRNGGRGR
jgi:hypothetical protein